MWREHAECRGMDSDWWVTAALSDRSNRQCNRLAVVVCARCPVRFECWEDAVEQADNGVIRGGVRMSPDSRKAPFPPLHACESPDCDQLFIPDGRWKYCSPECAGRASYIRRNAS